MKARSQGRTLPRAAGAIFLVLLSLPGVVAAAEAAADPGARRERDTGVGAPAISYIDSPTPTCVRPQPFSLTCRIEWEYLFVAADPGQYMVDMTVEIDGRLRAVMQGFFQTQIFVPAEMLEPGFDVACGAPGVSGDPDRGAAVPFTLRAHETGGLSASNSGTVWCPFSLLVFADDFERGNPSAWSSHTL